MDTSAYNITPGGHQALCSELEEKLTPVKKITISL